MADILNQGPAFWLPPDFLTDEDDDNFLIPHNPPAAAATAGGDHYSSFPKKLPSFNYPSSSSPSHQMDKDHLFLAAAFSSTLQHNTHFPCCPSKKQQQLISLPRPPGVIGTPSSSVRILKTPNGFLFPHPSPLPPPPPPSAPKNPPQAALYNGPLKQSISLTQQKFMLQNREGNRVIGGYGGSDQKKKTMASPPHSSAWPPLSQQRLNPPPPFLNGSHQVKRKCAGTGVFLPRNPLSDFQKKPDLATQVPVRKNTILFESQFIQNLDAASAAAMAARNRKVQLMNQQHLQQRLSFGTEGGGGSNELCLPQEWAY